jgi:hypothetical protein
MSQTLKNTANQHNGSTEQNTNKTAIAQPNVCADVCAHRQKTRRSESRLRQIMAAIAGRADCSLPVEPLAGEVWRSIPGYEASYWVSNLGRVANCNGIMHPSTNTRGYRFIKLSLAGVSSSRTIHGLVMEVFVGQRPDDMTVNHVDGDKGNNRLYNLEYCTQKQNIQHARAQGLYVRAGGGRKLKPFQVAEIRSLVGQLSDDKIAARYGVCPNTILNIRHKRAWKNVA